MPLLEIVKGEQTDDATLATAFATGKALKKTTILVKDSPSFIVNRLLGRFMGEVSQIVDEGTPIQVAGRRLRGRRPDAAVRAALAGRPGGRAAQQRDAAPCLPRPVLRLPNLEKLVAAGKPAIYGADGAVDPEVASMFETGRRGSPRTRCASAPPGLAEEACLMLDEVSSSAPRTSTWA